MIDFNGIKDDFTRKPCGLIGSMYVSAGYGLALRHHRLLEARRGCRVNPSITLDPAGAIKRDPWETDPDGTMVLAAVSQRAGRQHRHDRRDNSEP